MLTINPDHRLHESMAQGGPPIFKCSEFNMVVSRGQYHDQITWVKFRDTKRKQRRTRRASRPRVRSCLANEKADLKLSAHDQL